MVEVFELLLLFFATNTAADRHRRRDGRGWALQPALLVVQQLLQASIDLRSEQRLPGFEKLAKALDPPQDGVNWDPLGLQRTGVGLLYLGEILLREPVA